MTVYCRGDVAAVNLSVEGHGGCGQSHSRPVVDGAPVKGTWSVDCLECENHLRSDPLWSTTLAELPETYDETKVRERDEKMGRLDREQQLQEALIQLGQLPTALIQTLTQMSGGAPAALPGVLECGNGHAVPPGMKFCGECGAPMSGPVPKASLPAPPVQEPAAAKSVPRMRDGRVEVLQAFARANDLDDSGGRKDLIQRLSDAGLTAKWAGFASSYQPETAAA